MFKLITLNTHMKGLILTDPVNLSYVNENIIMNIIISKIS